MGEYVTFCLAGKPVSTFRVADAPKRGYSAAGFRGHETHDGVAFTADVLLDGVKVGIVENSGTGGATLFRPTAKEPGRYAETRKAFEDAARAAYPNEKYGLDVESFVDELLTTAGF